MAGDWIKMRASLCTNPKVLLIADIISQSADVGRRMSTGFNGSLSEIVTCDVTRDVTIASLLRVWCATNEHTTDGVWHNSTLRVIDQAAGIPGFGAAMAAAGWAIYDEQASTITMPNFLENNAPAKNNARSSGAERQAKYRQKLKEKSATRYVTSDVTSDVTVTSQSDAREEKRREENIDAYASIGTGAKDAPDAEHSATPSPDSLREKPPKALGLRELIAEGVDRQHAEDWLKVRRAKRAPLTPTAWEEVKREAAKAGITPAEAVKVSATNSWQGFKSSWFERAGQASARASPGIAEHNRRASEEAKRMLFGNGA